MIKKTLEICLLIFLIIATFTNWLALMFGISTLNWFGVLVSATAMIVCGICAIIVTDKVVS